MMGQQWRDSCSIDAFKPARTGQDTGWRGLSGVCMCTDILKIPSFSRLPDINLDREVVV
jgi:hypothetical protein